jgi:hypothetical protein
MRSLREYCASRRLSTVTYPARVPRALDFDGVVVQTNLDGGAAQRVVAVTDGVDERLTQCHRRILRHLFSDESPNDGIASHLVVDAAIGPGDE